MLVNYPHKLVDSPLHKWLLQCYRNEDELIIAQMESYLRGDKNVRVMFLSSNGRIVEKVHYDMEDIISTYVAIDLRERLSQKIKKSLVRPCLLLREEFSSFPYRLVFDYIHPVQPVHIRTVEEREYYSHYIAQSQMRAFHSIDNNVEIDVDGIIHHVVQTDRDLCLGIVNEGK